MFSIKDYFRKKNEISIDGFRVVCEDRAVKSRFLYCLDSFGISNFYNVLLDAGFKTDDVIYIDGRMNDLFKFNYSVNYSVNVGEFDDNYVIKFLGNNKEVSISNINGNRYYGNVNSNTLKNDEKRLLYYNKKISDDVSCFRDFETSDFFCVVNNGNYELSLDICTNCDISDDEFSDLCEYLTGLQFPIVIEEIYKKVCNLISLDETMMNMFNLVITNTVLNDVTDKILIQNGELAEFIRTADGRRVSINFAGVWSYEKINEDSGFTIMCDEEDESKYRYTFRDRSSFSNVYFALEDLVEFKNDASDEIDGVKKLVREIFYRDSN